MPDLADPFELFSLPRRYAIERTALEAAYERLTLAHHPDFFATAPAAEREQAERIAAAVNRGYRLLSDDAARAAWLLERLARGRALNAQALPAGFLQEMFALQEEVQALDDAADATDAAGAARRAEVRREAAAKLAHLAAERAALFATAERPIQSERQAEPERQTERQAEPEQLQAIQSNLNCERYLQRLLARLDGQRNE